MKNFLFVCLMAVFGISFAQTDNLVDLEKIDKVMVVDFEKAPAIQTLELDSKLELQFIHLEGATADLTYQFSVLENYDSEKDYYLKSIDENHINYNLSIYELDTSVPITQTSLSVTNDNESTQILKLFEPDKK